MPEKYKIVRFVMNGRNRVLQRGLTLAEAQEHCRDPETSSRTCQQPENKRRTKRIGPWFDGYDHQ